MIDLQWVRENKELAKTMHSKRPNTSSEDIDRLLELDELRRGAQGKLDEAKTVANTAAQEIGKLFKSGQREEAEALREKSKEQKSVIADLERVLRDASDALEAHWIQLPNLAMNEVPEGNSENDNKEIKGSSIPCVRQSLTPLGGCRPFESYPHGSWG